MNSRRQFLIASGASLGATGLSLSVTPKVFAALAGSPLDLKVAGYRFQRTAALFEGRTPVVGCKASFHERGIGDLNTDTFSGSQNWDVTEIGLHPYMLAYANQGFRDYALLPIYPLRLFRHKSAFIRNDRGIRGPADLRGKRVGTPGYSSTSLTWMRGIFKDEYGLDPRDIQWVTSRKDSSADVAGTASAEESMVPDGVAMDYGPEGVDESELLATGEVDALFHAATPRAYLEGHPQVSRLFEDSRAEEQAYFRKTGIFPIMHAVAVRRSLLDEHSWLAGALFKAYSQSKSVALRKMAAWNWADDMLPWYVQELEQTRELMGDNMFSYGMGNNRKVLDTLCRYSHEQGLSSRILKVEELFHSTSLDLLE